jgi:hypothetical protein
MKTVLFRFQIYLIAIFLFGYFSSDAQQKNCPQPTDSLFMPLYTVKAKKKVDDLGFMLTIICDKSTDPLDANTAIDNAVKLFIDEDASVQVSNIRDTTYRSKFKIREYLRRVKALKYDRVEIEWTSIQYVSDLRLGDDGNFHGVISYEQKFKGIRDGMIIYEDMTKKNTLVVVKPQSIEYDGKSFICWDVFLSDIEVTQTSSK